MKKILFISHDATRTGAPLIVLELLKWLNSHAYNSIHLDILLGQGGVMVDDFEKESTNFYIHSEIHQPLKFKDVFLSKLYSKIKIKRKSKETLFFDTIAHNNYDLIYANSVVSLPFAVKIKQRCPRVKLLVHVHELDTIIKQAVPNFKSYIPFVDKYIAVSNVVKGNLITEYEVNNNLISLVYEFGVIKDELVVKNNSVFTVGASGLAHWRKGHDVFLHVAHYVKQNYPDAKIKFVWVGKYSSQEQIIKADIEKMELKEVVDFVGEQTNPVEYYKNFDVFVLTSREDPFPLVCIEVAHLRKPIICFEKASGTTEVIEKGGGFIVPYLDVSAMAEKIMWYYSNPDKVIVDGEIAQKLFSEFTPEKMIPLIYEQINSLLNE